MLIKVVKSTWSHCILPHSLVLNPRTELLTELLTNIGSMFARKNEVVFLNMAGKRYFRNE